MINLQQNEGGGSSVGSGDGSQQLKKGPWTAAEDAVLADYVRNHGEGNWNAVQKNTGLNRCGKSCRLRWANHLRPNLKKGSFSPEEERLIVELHSKVGNKWARMASQMPGRTDNEIKNYWNTRIKRRLRQGLPLYPPDVQPLYHNGQQSPSPSPSLPSTTASSFSFHTPPQISPHAMSPLSHLYAANNQFMHMPPLQSPHSPTPPPFYTPYNSHFTASATLQSPSQPTTPPPSYNLNAASPIASPNLVYPTLPLLNTSSTPASLSSINTTTTAASSNFLPRSPPSLQLPDRIKRFHHEDGESYGNFESCANVSSIGTSMSCSMSSSAMFSFSSLPKGSVLTPSVATTTTDALPHPMFPSFSVDPTSLNTTLASRVLHAHFDQGLAVSDPGLANQIKLEPPSSQILSQDHNFEMRFDTNREENISDHNQQGLIVGANGIGILEDLLEETQMLASSSDSFSLHDCSRMQDEKHLFVMPKSEPGPSISADFASVANPKKEPAAEFECSHEDLSKVLKAIPTSMQVPEWYSDGGEGSNGQSSVVTDDNPGVELNSMDSFFQPYTVCDNTMAPKSCPWDNLPRIC